jgi:hypothetical protein
MVRGETELEMAQRHVSRGREIVARQRAIIERRKAANLSVALAEELLSELQTTQRLLEARTAGIPVRDNYDERQCFTNWTFDKELDQIEGLLGTFDRKSPTADIAEARKLIALLGIINNAPEMDAAFPRFLGHDMHWWVECISLVGDNEQWLRGLGIHATMEAWVAAEHDWNYSRTAPASDTPIYGLGITRISHKR